MTTSPARGADIVDARGHGVRDVVPVLVVFGSWIKHCSGPVEMGLVRAGQDDEAAVAGEDIAQVEEKNKVRAADLAVFEVIAPHIGPFGRLPSGVQVVEAVAVAVIAEGAAGEARPAVGEFHEDRPSRRMPGEHFEAFVKGKAVLIAGDSTALEVCAEFGRPLFGRHVDVAVGCCLGGCELLWAEYAAQVEVAGQIEKVALVGCHHGVGSLLGWGKIAVSTAPFKRISLEHNPA